MEVVIVNKGNICKMKVRADEMLEVILKDCGYEKYKKIKLYGKDSMEYWGVYGVDGRSWKDVVDEWKLQRGDVWHITICNISSDGSFCIGVVDNWEELDSYARHYILLMES